MTNTVGVPLTFSSRPSSNDRFTRSAVAGSAKIGRYCLIGGGAGVLGHLQIADKVTVTSMALVTHSIHEPGEYSSGTPIQDNRSWRRNAARFKHLDELTRRVQALEKETKD